MATLAGAVVAVSGAVVDVVEVCCDAFLAQPASAPTKSAAVINEATTRMYISLSKQVRGRSQWSRRCEGFVYFFFLFTASRRSLPAWNAGTVRAAIMSFSPVLGLRPSRALRLRVSK